MNEIGNKFIFRFLFSIKENQQRSKNLLEENDEKYNKRRNMLGRTVVEANDLFGKRRGTFVGGKLLFK